MIRMIMHGCFGKMGRAICDLVANDPNCKMVAGVDVRKEEAAFPVFPTISQCDIEADVIIDFSTATAMDELLNYCGEKKIALVLCTTGLTPLQLEAVEETAKVTPILRSANMSLGVNILLKLVQEAAKVLAVAGFDMEIVERHHNLKLDAPSGTAIAFADALNTAMDDAYEYTYDRSTERKMREKNEIGISAVRGGTIVGEHEIIFAGPDEVVEFKHTAYSKTVFAKGAIEAAKFLADQPARLYNMTDVIG